MSNTRSNETTVMSASDVRQHFGDVVNRVARGEGRVIVEKNGAPAVGVVSMEDVRRLRNHDRVTEGRRKFLAEFREPFKDIPDEELETEIAKALAEVKKERRQERLPLASTGERQVVRGAGR